jgi:hypothetical protein
MDFIMPDLISLTKMAPLLGKLAGSLAESAKGPAPKKKDELKVRFKVGFDEYISQQAARYSNVKTIIGSNIPLKLKDVFVSASGGGSERVEQPKAGLASILDF